MFTLDHMLEPKAATVRWFEVITGWGGVAASRRTTRCGLSRRPWLLGRLCPRLPVGMGFRRSNCSRGADRRADLGRRREAKTVAAVLRALKGGA